MSRAARIGLLTFIAAALSVLGYLIAVDRMNPAIDKDGDGRFDEWFHYDLRGRLVALEKDRNHDGKIDHREQFEDGMIATSQTDMDNNGVFEVNGAYDDVGRLIEMGRDRDQDGTIDRLTRMDPESQKQLWYHEDSDGDGKMDRSVELVPGSLSSHP